MHFSPPYWCHLTCHSCWRVFSERLAPFCWYSCPVTALQALSTLWHHCQLLPPPPPKLCRALLTHFSHVNSTHIITQFSAQTRLLIHNWCTTSWKEWHVQTKKRMWSLISRSGGTSVWFLKQEDVVKRRLSSVALLILFVYAGPFHCYCLHCAWTVILFEELLSGSYHDGWDGWDESRGRLSLFCRLSHVQCHLDLSLYSGFLLVSIW